MAGIMTLGGVAGSVHIVDRPAEARTPSFR
jgi:hypothetical protein